MTEQKRARINPVLLLPACLFGTRLIHGLIFRPHHGENDEVKEHLEEEEVVEVVANEECSDSVEQGSVDGGKDDDGLEEASNHATWETLSLESEVSNASTVTPVAVAPNNMESCSRSVLMHEWLRGLKLCHPPRYAEKWGVDLGAGVQVPAQHLERQMERAQCFMNPMYHMLQSEEPKPLQPPTIPAVCVPLTVPTPAPKKLSVKFPEVEPFNLGKHRTLSAGKPRGGFTSRSDGAYEVTATKRRTRLNFKSSTTLSVAGTPRTPRRLCSPPRCVTPIAAQAWVRSNSTSRNGVDYRNIMRPRDSAEEMYLSVRRVEVASTS
ncbi:hypothetical protein BSKO_06706 [Bryopsis sp. KO-2023]|nr:hypothetical protein BSKO_06706 [Bryopsis sp. KO-2023]